MLFAIIAFVCLVTLSIIYFNDVELPFLAAAWVLFFVSIFVMSWLGMGYMTFLVHFLILGSIYLKAQMQ